LCITYILLKVVKLFVSYNVTIVLSSSNLFPYAIYTLSGTEHADVDNMFTKDKISGYLF